MPKAANRTNPRAARRVAASFALAAFAAAPLADASVYKCQGDAGVVYQETPCPAGRALRDFDSDPPDLSVIHGGLARGTVAAEKPAAAPPARSELPAAKNAGSAKERKFIHSGMSEAEVLARIGPPDATSGGGKSRQTRWSYLPAEDDPDTVTSITFAAGVVSDVARKVIRR